MSLKIKKVLIVLFVIAAVSFIMAGLLYYFTGGLHPVASSRKIISQSEEIDLSGIQTINISTISTPVEIVNIKKDKLLAHFGGEIFSGSDKKIPELSINKDRTELRIKINYPFVLNFGSYNISDLMLKIKIPENFSGTVITNTISGKTDVRNINARELKSESVSGVINIESVKADYIELHNTSGGCNAREIKAKIFVDTVSGGVFLGINELEDEVRVQTVSGPAQIRIPEGSSFDFEFSTTSGVIKSNAESAVDFADRQHLKGRAGDGETKIYISTVSGNILLAYK